MKQLPPNTSHSQRLVRRLRDAIAEMIPNDQERFGGLLIEAIHEIERLESACNKWSEDELLSPPPLTNYSASWIPFHDAPTWVRTSDRLPGELGEQTDILMWSPEWATWLKGMVTRCMDGTCEWDIYDQQEDRYHKWEYPPEFWMSPIMPTDQVEVHRK